MSEYRDSAHIYRRKISPSERTSLSAIAAAIGPGSKVLDLGTGSGALGSYLSSERQCTVDGVTYNQQEADIAASSYRRIVVADLDNCSLEALFLGERYDYIVCADVLEHTKNPRRTIDAVRALVLPHGKVVLSMPNACYCGLIAELMHGEFRYRDEGLLDHTHLRFFTRSTLLYFLDEAGWTPETIDTIERPLNESEFGIEFDMLSPAVARYLLALPDALTYQFIVTAVPTHLLNGTQSKVIPESRPAPKGIRHATFSAQVYLGKDGSLAEDRKLVAAGKIGESRQELLFRLPLGPEEVSNLRLDPADRPGFLHLYKISLRKADGQVVWSWSFSKDGAEALLAGSTHEILHCRTTLITDSVLLALLGDDPWIDLQIPPGVLSDTAAGELIVELGWPMSADFMAIEKTVAVLMAERNELSADIHTLPIAKGTVETKAIEPLEVQDLKAELLVLSRRIEQLEGSFALRLFAPIYRAKYWASHWLGKLFEARNNSTVDVIIPVYTGIGETRSCIESVLSSRCQTPFRVVLINDASPDPELTQWLRKIAVQDSRITLLENENNMGFVATVNRGMQQSGVSDVLLLNSDTEVANDWLDRLRTAAYSDARVGSVTPFSNNATICSYPKFCEVNHPPDIGTAALDLLFAKINRGQVVDIPTGVGFCMYVRRDCIKEVGLFDLENFGRGYGEENDFCVRASSAGWRNLHALDVFVLHTGGVSFGDSKSDREIAAMQTLRRLHPGYEPCVHAFLELDPARFARDRVAQVQRK